MAKVTGIGGVFFKSAAPKKLTAWYHKHLGIPLDEYGKFGWCMDPEGRRIELWQTPNKN